MKFIEDFKETLFVAISIDVYYNNEKNIVEIYNDSEIIDRFSDSEAELLIGLFENHNDDIEFSESYESGWMLATMRLSKLLELLEDNEELINLLDI